MKLEIFSITIPRVLCAFLLITLSSLLVGSASNRVRLKTSLRKILRTEYGTYLGAADGRLWKEAQEDESQWDRWDVIADRLRIPFTLWQAHKDTIIAQAMAAMSDTKESKEASTTTDSYYLAASHLASSSSGADVAHDQEGDSVIKKSDAFSYKLAGRIERIPCTDAACPQVFAMRQSRRSHIKKLHDPKRPLPCPYPPCSARFVNESVMTRHSAEHIKRGDVKA